MSNRTSSCHRRDFTTSRCTACEPAACEPDADAAAALFCCESIGTNSPESVASSPSATSITPFSKYPEVGCRLSKESALCADFAFGFAFGLAFPSALGFAFAFCFADVAAAAADEHQHGRLPAPVRARGGGRECACGPWRYTWQWRCVAKATVSADAFRVQGADLAQRPCLPSLFACLA